MARILALAGSLRADSWNRKLLALAVREAERLGAEIDLVDLKVLALPVYDGDVEDHAFPPAARELKDRIAAAPGLLISSPEYNSSIPGGLKNAIDWASRPPTNPFRGKVAALMGASDGRYGTIRMQPHLRQVLHTLGTMVIPTGALIARAQDEFDAQGNLKNENRQREVAQTVAELLAEIRRRGA